MEFHCNKEGRLTAEQARAHVAAKLEDVLRLTKSGSIDGVIILAHHVGNGDPHSFSIAGLTHFNVPKLVVIGQELLARLRSEWFDSEITGDVELHPSIGPVDDDG